MKIKFKFVVYETFCNIIVTHTQAAFTRSLSLVEAAYRIVNMIQVINKEVRATY